MPPSQLYDIFHHWLRFKVSQMRDDARKAEKVLHDAGYPAARVVPDFDFARDADRKTHRVRLPVQRELKRKVEVKFVGNRAISAARAAHRAHHLLRRRLRRRRAGRERPRARQASTRSTASSRRASPSAARCAAPPSTPPASRAATTSRRSPSAVDEGPELKVQTRRDGLRHGAAADLHRRRPARQGGPRDQAVPRARRHRPRRRRLRHAGAAAAGRRSHRQPLQVARLPRRQGALRGGARPGRVRCARRVRRRGHRRRRRPRPLRALLHRRRAARDCRPRRARVHRRPRQERPRRLHRGAARLRPRVHHRRRRGGRAAHPQPLQGVGAPAGARRSVGLDVERGARPRRPALSSSTKGPRCASARSSSAATSRRTARRSARTSRSSRATSTTSRSWRRPSATCRRTSSSTRRACRRRCSRDAPWRRCSWSCRSGYLRAPTAMLTFAVGAASDRLPDYAYVSATTLGRTFSATARSSSCAATSPSWRRCSAIRSRWAPRCATPTSAPSGRAGASISTARSARK